MALMKQHGRVCPMTPWIILLELPWPAAALSPNRRQHWAKKASAVDAYRTRCRLGARRLQIPPTALDGVDLHLFLDFWPPDRRHYDLDNLIARMKAGIDGICDHLRIDDYRLRAIYARLAERHPDGRVTLRLTPWNQNA